MRTTVWYVLCSIAVLYDHTETSYFLSLYRPRLPMSLALTHSEYFEANSTSVPWTLLRICGTFLGCRQRQDMPFPRLGGLGVLFYIAILYESADTNFLFSIIGLVGFLPPKKFRTTAWRCHRYTAGQILEDLPCAIQ